MLPGSVCGLWSWPRHPQLLFAATLSSVLDKPCWAVSRLRCLCAGEAVCELGVGGPGSLHPGKNRIHLLVAPQEVSGRNNLHFSY